jgi:hypothetical protein
VKYRFRRPKLGYARGSNKRIIQTARKDTALEFDVRNWHTIIYRNATELEEKLILELKAAHSEVMLSRGASPPNEGMQATGNSFRSFLAPPIPRA